MKNNTGFAGWVITILVLANSPFVPFVLAAVILQGEIVEIDPQGTFLRVARSDPATNASEPEAIKVFIQTNSQMEGAAIADLRIGDEVWIDAEKNETDGSWVAKKIQLDKVDIKTTGTIVNKAEMDAVPQGEM